MARDHVTVGIVGGGIAGLTLAKMLEMSGISYILYESYHQISPDAGASLGWQPNGLRILDQLGLIDQVESFSVAHDMWEHRNGETGGLLKCTTAMRHYPAVFGYGAFFMARRDVLRLLYDSLKDNTRIQTSKRVTSILDFEDSAVIETADGSSITCDFVAGADGLRSIVRQHICDRTVQPSPDYLRAKATCVFGISKPLAQIGPGRHFTIYQQNVSALVFSGLHGKLYWFLTQAEDEQLDFGKTKVFTDADIETVYEKIADAIVTDDVHISDVYASREIALMTALEEGLADVSYFGRMFLLGDSAHKMVPHAAMGANQAMESAACFVNNLRKLQSSPGRSLTRVSRSQVSECLESYTKQRRSRVCDVVESASRVCRNQLLIGSRAEMFIQVLPYLKDGDILLKAIESLIKAEKLEDWKWGSKRVDYYTEQCGKALKNWENHGDLRALGIHEGER